MNPLPVLAVTVANPAQQPQLFRQVAHDFPGLTYYDADIALPVRHAAVYGSFPLCRLRVRVDPQGVVQSLKVKDSPWEADTPLPKLQILKMRPGVHLVPELGLHIDREKPGLVPRTLRPLLEKRVALKTALLEMPAYDPRRKRYQAYAAAHKWLLVTCFGYLGYKNARFGRIEAYEAVTAYGREALLRAKEAAEDLGFTVLHMYVDGLWVRKDRAVQVEDFQPLLDEILARTGLPISLDGVYKWVAFLPSRSDARVLVANRYFGAFKSGKLKLRGIEIRRHDTPPLIKKTQLEIIERMVVADSQNLRDVLPWVTQLLRRKLVRIHRGRIPLDDLLVTQKLSREVDTYRVPSPVARAVLQLAGEGKSIRPGQYVRFIYTFGDPGVHAWDLAVPLNPAAVDVGRYRTLLIRAAHTVLQPLGVTEQELASWLHDDTGYGTRQGDFARNLLPF
jgi:DNA polymerase-2